MKIAKRIGFLTFLGTILLLILGACEEGTATLQPVTPTNTLTSQTSTTVATTSAVAITFATQAPTVTTSPTVTTVPVTTTSPATTSAPTTGAPIPTQDNGPAYPPTFTVGPTPQASPVAANWVKDGVCYEVFVRSFYDSNGDGKGDLKGLIAKLDYLNDGNPNSTKSLGINCIWLMPIMASPSYHGYDTTDYYKVNPDYGTNDDFKTLMQEAHKRGIQVIIDFVINHTSNQNEWFQQAASNPQSPYRNWYIFSPTDPGYLNPWGGQAWWKNPLGDGYYYGVFDRSQPDLNYRNPAVTKQMYDVTRFWLQEMGVDGFRIDAAKHLIEDGPNQQDTPETHAWLRDFHNYYSSVKPNAFAIGEVNGPSLELRGYYPDQLDYYFEFGLAQSLVKSASEGSAAFLNYADIANNLWPLQRFGTFLTNHDQNRIASELNGDTAKLKMAAAAYLTVPGLPFIYYGEEIGMQGTGEDPQKRTPMQWANVATTGGFTSGTPWETLNPSVATANVQSEDSDPNSLLNLYRQLVHLRRTHTALATGDMLALTSNKGSVAAYLRHAPNEDILVVLNMGDAEAKDLKLSLDSSSLVLGQYRTQILLDISKEGASIAPLTVGNKGAIQDYSFMPSLAAHSGYIVLLKKS